MFQSQCLTEQQKGVLEDLFFSSLSVQEVMEIIGDCSYLLLFIVLGSQPNPSRIQWTCDNHPDKQYYTIIV